MKRPRVIVSLVVAALTAAAAATAGASPASAQARTGGLAGVVYDTRGATVRDATIIVYPADLAGPELARLTVDTDGRFHVPAVPPGAYKILIARHAWFEWAPGRITDSAKAFPYRVFAGHDTRVVSVVTAPGVIAGRVRTPAGGPAAGVAVSVDHLTTASAWYTTTAPDGTYAVNLPPGSDYAVSFTDGELTQHSPRTLDWALARHYTVRSGRTVRVDERLLAPASVGGTFTDEHGTPIAGAAVGLILLDTAGEVWTTTGPDGSYLFDKLPPGTVIVQFGAAGRTQWAYGKTSFETADRFTLSLGTLTTVDDTLLPLAATAPGF